jgi:hypothetical protein
MTAARDDVDLGPIVAGGTVILSGVWVEAARQAVLIAVRARYRNGMPISARYSALTSALNTAAMSANGHSDVRKTEVLQDYPHEHPTVTIDQAAHQLGLSARQVRRIAAELGGRKVGGRWLLDQTAITERNTTWTR